jgi:hypothetical protein
LHSASLKDEDLRKVDVCLFDFFVIQSHPSAQSSGRKSISGARWREAPSSSSEN